MKKLVFILLTSAIIFPVFANQASDTTIVVNNKQIQIDQENDRMKVRVFELTQEGDSIEKEMIFEGHYRDGNVHERKKYSKTISFSVPSPMSNWNRKFDPHWSSFGLGFNSFADNNLKINNVNDVSLRMGKSLEYTFNFFEKALPFAKNNLAFVTGLGMTWNRYHLSENESFQKENGEVVILSNPNDRNYSKTRLGVNSFTLPLLLEWQSKGKKSSRFFISAGAVGAFNYTSASKVKYVNSSGKKQKEKLASDLYVRPLSVDFLVQAGFGDCGLYAKYSPLELFENGKGPEVYPVSLGIMMHF